MSLPTHRITISTPKARSVAIAALLGATFLFSPLTTVRAESPAVTPIQLPQTTPPQAGVEAPDTKVETVEQRITNLHQALKITPDQESKWTDVAQAMRENAAAMQKLVSEKATQSPQNMTAVQDLKAYEKFTQAHADGLKNLIPDFEALYNFMPDPQKKIADEVFQNFGHKGAR
ncbi:MAG: Spy/CpxP family protein refolding chaperone [Alphaproteobacteria bacterium]|nr:Spy/CpxP family protein refolding chaperone [Alphaproteobacteria bacterium]